MKDAWAFLKALVGDWAGLVSGAFSVPFTVAAFVLPEGWGQTVSIAGAIVLALFAVFRS
jgi:hypothetical protein